ncbi:MAG: site-specific integrase [Lachnospiraceae bacterium]|nr:site-specific integrase [Lachnospiraceae bacterium]
MSGKNNSVTGCLIERKGKYYVVVSYYVDGHRMQDTKSTGIAISSHKKREAERIKDSLIHEKEKELEQAAVAKTSHSFADCFERWIDYKSAQTESTTAWGYKSKSKSIIKYFRDKNTMIEGLKPKDVFAYYEWALEEGRQQVYNENMPKGLSRRTVRDQSTLIKGFLNDAVVQGIISINPADKAEVPRVKENNTKETAYMDAEQAEAFLNFVKSDKHFKKLYCISKLGLYYGFRRSEILGLKWSAIDFEKGEIVINHTVVRGINGVEYRDNVKTESSHRYLPLLELVKNDLMELMKRQKTIGIYDKDGYVFKWEDGRIYDPDYITKLFKKAVSRCDAVPDDMTFHGLRHSCCALLFEKGWDLGKVQNWLGHSDIAVTANIYNHVSKKWRNKQGKMIDELFG